MYKDIPIKFINDSSRYHDNDRQLLPFGVFHKLGDHIEVVEEDICVEDQIGRTL